ncbi:endonuclease/exonuclease/phosphatase family protein [Streptomyces scopuliridis]|uniref:Endonuclease/exonuclease/phosphatase family protein n=1 Tax=Streptomyces scopuliridis TaxID=452529 RepID=A0ACD4ZT67_9ACTN|nr:endonuclease/exonuclease/phosphatase family protein [Streptomyces scopuliridis]WSC01646.1 endonuclease/exonuclease/phosphatase family protein [Streptomyces scopuliridis]WSC04815.1 endonuclease/exonuclease/phosphatase family protein [Streptomyces scopuliridis]
MRTIRLANLNAYKLTPATRGTSSWNARATAIQEIAPDILALQEVVIDESATRRESRERQAAELIQDLAEQCGLTSQVGATDGYPHGTAMAANWHRTWFTALLWNPNTVQLVDNSYRPYGAPDFWHGCATAHFDVGAGQPLLVASYHGDPFRPDFRANEALRLKGIFRQTGGVKPGFCVGDFNSISAAEVDDGNGGRRYYDDEPYLDMRHDDLEFQIQAGSIGGEQLADRRQTEVLLRKGYMVDAAAHLGVPWRPTVGHWEDGRGDPDPWGVRRIDLILATRSVAPALTGYKAHKSAAAKEAADHLPVYAEFDPSKIVREFANSEGRTGVNSRNIGPGVQG